jgi:thiamine monophosphate kinase
MRPPKENMAEIVNFSDLHARGRRPVRYHLSLGFQPLATANRRPAVAIAS